MIDASQCCQVHPTCYPTAPLIIVTLITRLTLWLRTYIEQRIPTTLALLFLVVSTPIASINGQRRSSLADRPRRSTQMNGKIQPLFVRRA